MSGYTERFYCNNSFRFNEPDVSGIRRGSDGDDPALLLVPNIHQAEELVTKYGLDKLKEISNRIIADTNYRTLIPRSIYSVKLSSDDSAITIFPTSTQELQTYENAIPNIVLNVQKMAEHVLEKKIDTMNLLYALEFIFKLTCH